MAYKALAFVRRDLQTQASYRLSLITRIAGMVVSVSTYFYISKTLGVAVSPYLDRYGGDYFRFILMSMILSPFIYLSLDAMSQAVNTYQSSGTLEVLFLSPTPILQILMFSSLWNYIWAFLEALFYLLAAILLFRSPISFGNPVAILLAVCLSILSHLGLGLFNAGYVLVTKRTSPLSRFLTIAISLLGGAYFPIEVLPTWLGRLSQLLPTRYAFNALRGAMLRDASLRDLAPDLLAMAAFSVLLLPVGLIALRYAVRRARIDGSLGQY